MTDPTIDEAPPQLTQDKVRRVLRKASIPTGAPNSEAREDDVVVRALCDEWLARAEDPYIGEAVAEEEAMAKRAQEAMRAVTYMSELFEREMRLIRTLHTAQEANRHLLDARLRAVSKSFSRAAAMLRARADEQAGGMLGQTVRAELEALADRLEQGKVP